MMEVLIFSVANKEYAVDVFQVREVIRMRKITSLPDVAVHTEGVITLRGQIIPVIHMGKRLGLSVSENTRLHRIMITNNNNQPVGMIVDSVTDICTIPDDHITPPGDVLQEAAYLTGVIKHGDSLIVLMDLQKLLSGGDQESFNKVRDRVSVKKKE